MGGQEYNWNQGAEPKYVNMVSANNYIRKTTIILF